MSSVICGGRPPSIVWKPLSAVSTHVVKGDVAKIQLKTIGAGTPIPSAVQLSRIFPSRKKLAFKAQKR